MAAPSPPDLHPPVAELWAEMRLHMEWSEGLSLCFLFAPGHAALVPLAQWADDAWAWRTAPMLRLEPDQPEPAATQVLTALEAHVQRLPDTRAPVWVQLLTLDGSDSPPAWDAARAALLARLNEAREWLRGDFARPLILALPQHWQHLVSEVAPDLWQVRTFTAVVPGGTQAPVQAASPKPDLPMPQQVEAELAPLRAGVVQAQDRLAQAKPEQQAALQRELLEALWDLADGLLEHMQVVAVETAAQGLALARQLRASLGETPQVLRDLSISLDNVGAAENAAGRGDAAVAAYRESLALRRQLRASLGETPQVLRDLAVSLERIASFRSVSHGERLAAAQEAVALRKRLTAALGSDHHAQRLHHAKTLLQSLQPLAPDAQSTPPCP